MQQPDRNIFAVRNTMNRVKRVESTLYILWGDLKKACERGIVTSKCGFTLAYDRPMVSCFFAFGLDMPDCECTWRHG
jgi:hypothetical protein